MGGDETARQGLAELPVDALGFGHALEDGLGLVQVGAQLVEIRGKPFEVREFHVLEGEMTFFVGEERLHAPAGTFVFLPRGVPHGFTVDRTGVARVLELCSPAGVERFSSEWGDHPLDVHAMSAAPAPCGVEIVGPPPRQLIAA